ncbi:hypothetical protein M9H77_18232 [Catharanthus roseus]|uniref:Uncharacterized protein n=1 Tax=Catharanthus roseus TaxID=4058 RepID=A0ACC0B6Y1_CATRO|nr:hypothetical protein M9H77_18232 [Catharanthus roseus]
MSCYRMTNEQNKIVLDWVKKLYLQDEYAYNLFMGRLFASSIEIYESLQQVKISSQKRFTSSPERDVITGSKDPDRISDHVYSFSRIVCSVLKNYWPIMLKSVYTRQETPENKFENIVRGTARSVMQELVDSPRVFILYSL